MTATFEPRSCRPRQHLDTATRLYPKAWSDIEHMRQVLRGRAVPDWPAWCFIPIAGPLAAVANDAGVPVEELGLRLPERIVDGARLAALAAWRMTQGIYRFDPAVYEAVRDTPVNGDIPHEVLFTMPEWCVYIETPGLTLDQQPVAGAFAHLEHDANDGRKELRLLIDLDQSGQPMLIPVPLHLGAWSLSESITRALDTASVTSMAHGGAALPASLVHPMRALLEPVVSLLLYVCSQAGEISGARGVPANPQPVRTRRSGWRLFPADGPKTWDVGVRLGAALRTAYAAEQTGAQEGSRGGVRGHVRRAHWHTYLRGARLRDGQPVPSDQRISELRWQPPIAVALASPTDLPATVRPVV